MKTPIDVLLAVTAIGGCFRTAGDELRMKLPKNCQPEVKEAIRHHKAALLELLPLTFLIVRSEALGTTVFWTSDEFTKTSLMAAGAEPGQVYTACELERLVNSQPTVHDLRLIHTTKCSFRGKVTG